MSVPLLRDLLLFSLLGNFWAQVACVSPQVPPKGPSRAPKLSTFDAKDHQIGTLKINFPRVGSAAYMLKVFLPRYVCRLAFPQPKWPQNMRAHANQGVGGMGVSQ